MQDHKQYQIDNHFGWQIDRPVFVKQGFQAFGKQWNRGDEFNWINQTFRKEDWFKQLKMVHNLYRAGYLHHDSQREKQNTVGDRLNEMTGDQLYKLVSTLNSEIQRRSGSKEEFNRLKCKISKIEDKQRGLIRQWRRRNTWADDLFYQYRDSILKEASKPVSEE